MADGPEDGKPTPSDPLMGMAEMAVTTHELFLAYKAAGFEPREALYLTGEVITAGLRPHS